MRIKEKRKEKRGEEVEKGEQKKERRKEKEELGEKDWGEKIEGRRKKRLFMGIEPVTLCMV